MISTEINKSLEPGMIIIQTIIYNRIYKELFNFALSLASLLRCTRAIVDLGAANKK